MTETSFLFILIHKKAAQLQKVRGLEEKRDPLHEQLD